MGRVLNLPLSRDCDPRLEINRRDAKDLHHMLRTLPQAEGLYNCLGYLLPLPVEKLAEALGVRIQLVDDLTRVAGPGVEVENEICGALSRISRTIFVEGRLPLEQRRYVIGHEYAHLLYHSEAIHYSQRSSRAEASGVRGDVGRVRAPVQEREAQRFSAELLMPEEAVRKEFIARFGCPLDTTLAGEELAYFLTIGTRQMITPRHLREMPLDKKAALVAQTKSFGNLLFEPLHKRFGVSIEAMALRLLELDLV